MATYGQDNASYEAAGQTAGVRALVDDFYLNMSRFPEATGIFAMHGALESSREKLTVFLCAWLGGPKEYTSKFGPIRIPQAHAHLNIGQAERDAWMLCMTEAVAQQPWAADFKEYFCTQIAVPADRVQHVSQRSQAGKKSL